MLDKIKKVVLYILLPLTAVVGYIIYLLSKVSDLKTSLAQSNAEKDLAQAMDKKVEADYEANQSEIDYNRIRAQFIEQQRTLTGEDPAGGKPEHHT